LESQQQRRLKEYNAIQEQQRRESLNISKSQLDCPSSPNHYDPKSNIDRGFHSNIVYHLWKLLFSSFFFYFFVVYKETILLCQPPCVASRTEFPTRTTINGSERSETSSSQNLLHPSAAAPIITHTAATPQGSPNATLDSICSHRDSSSSSCVRLSPLKSVKLVGVSPRTSAETSPLHSGDGGGGGINLVSEIAESCITCCQLVIDSSATHTGT
jgi:hypothetical protein